MQIKTSVRTAGLKIEVTTQDLSNTKYSKPTDGLLRIREIQNLKYLECATVLYNYNTCDRIQCLGLVRKMIKQRVSRDSKFYRNSIPANISRSFSILQHTLHTLQPSYINYHVIHLLVAATVLQFIIITELSLVQTSMKLIDTKYTNDKYFGYSL